MLRNVYRVANTWLGVESEETPRSLLRNRRSCELYRRRILGDSKFPRCRPTHAPLTLSMTHCFKPDWLGEMLLVMLRVMFAILIFGLLFFFFFCFGFLVLLLFWGSCFKLGLWVPVPSPNKNIHELQ